MSTTFATRCNTVFSSVRLSRVRRFDFPKNPRMKPWARCARLLLLCLLLGGLLPCTALQAPAIAVAAALPDFEEDISLGLGESKLRALGAKPCPEAALCLSVRWGEQSWKATLRLQAGTLDVVELHPAGPLAAQAAREQLEEFALAPVRVKAGDMQCDAFALLRQGKSADKAVDICAEKLDALKSHSAGAQCSVWYVDEDQVEELLQAGSLENAASKHPRAVGARLSMAPGAVEVGYGHLGSLLQPSLKP